MKAVLEVTVAAGLGDSYQRMWTGKKWLLATDTAGSWKRRLRSSCLLLSPQSTLPPSLPRGGRPAIALTHSHTPTNCYAHFALQLHRQGGQEEGSEESTAPQPQPWGELTWRWHTHTHGGTHQGALVCLTHSLLEWKRRVDEGEMNQTDMKDEAELKSDWRSKSFKQISLKL